MEPTRLTIRGAAKLPRANGDAYAAIKVRTEETYVIVVEVKRAAAKALRVP
jgi:hypothetical protein